MSDVIHVLHVVGRMDRGGTEALLMSLLHTVDRSRFQFDLVEQTQDECDYDQEILSLGSAIYRCPHISPGNLSGYRKWWRDFFAAHPEYRIVHGHSRGSAPIYLDEAKKAGRVTILHCHSNSHGKGLPGLIRFLWQLPLRRMADHNFACSVNAGISQFGKSSTFRVIKNGIRAERYLWNSETRHRIREEFGLSDEFVIGNVARFEDMKNHKFLLRVFREVLNKNPNARLMLVGQGTLEKQIRQQAQELGITEQVIFTGVRSDVNDVLQGMDMFVFPSVYEGLPLVLVEAQTAGLRCVISDTISDDCVIGDDLITKRSLESTPEQWAEHILQRAQYTRENQYQQVAESGFDIRSTYRQLCEFYEGVLQDA